MEKANSKILDIFISLLTSTSELKHLHIVDWSRKHKRQWSSSPKKDTHGQAQARCTFKHEEPSWPSNLPSVQSPSRGTGWFVILHAWQTQFGGHADWAIATWHMPDCCPIERSFIKCRMRHPISLLPWLLWKSNHWWQVPMGKQQEMAENGLPTPCYPRSSPTDDTEPPQILQQSTFQSKPCHSGSDATWPHSHLELKMTEEK